MIFGSVSEFFHCYQKLGHDRQIGSIHAYGTVHCSVHPYMGFAAGHYDKDFEQRRSRQLTHMLGPKQRSKTAKQNKSTSIIIN